MIAHDEPLTEVRVDTLGSLGHLGQALELEPAPARAVYQRLGTPFTPPPGAHAAPNIHEEEEEALAYNWGMRQP